jgi:Kef-type K+ transport system membrane component KefB
LSSSLFQTTLITIAVAFTLAFGIVVMPPLIQSRDVLGAFAAGFVNPNASGYAMDAICCWCVLTTLVIYERRTKGVQNGWIAVLLGMVPGVAVGFAFYLLLRLKQDQAANTDRISAP